jgi:hypothetical protein
VSQRGTVFRSFRVRFTRVRAPCARTVRLVHREVEGALLATQLLLAQGVRAVPVGRGGKALPRCSPRQVLTICEVGLTCSWQAVRAEPAVPPDCGGITVSQG